MTQELTTEIAPQSTQMSTVFANERSFALAQRMAQALMSASMLPQEFQGNMGNTLIILELSQRLGASPFMVAQNVDVIHGRPSMRAQFVIACLNASGRFSPLDFRFSGTEGQDDWSCQAFAQSKQNGVEVSGPKISIAMAKAEGWYSKGGSKWKTIPELMLRYRAGAWFGRLHAPDILMGMQTAEEASDIIDVRQQIDGTFAVGGDAAADAEAILEGNAKPADKSVEKPKAKARPAAKKEPEPKAEPEAEPEGPTRADLLASVKAAKTTDELNGLDLNHLNDADYTEVEAAINDKFEALKQAAEGNQ